MSDQPSSSPDQVRSEKILSLAARAREQAALAGPAKAPKPKKDKPVLSEEAKAAVALLAQLPKPLLALAMKELRAAGKGSDSEPELTPEEKDMVAETDG